MTKRSEATYRRAARELLAAFLLAVCIFALSLWRLTGQPEDIQDLRIAASDLESLASEGQLLASQQWPDSITSNYLLVQRRAWHAKIVALHVQQRSARPAADVAEMRRALLLLCERLVQSAQEWLVEADDKVAAPRAAKKLAELTREAKTLEASLRAQLAAA